MAKARTRPKIDFSAYAKEHLAYEARMFVEGREIFFKRAANRSGLDLETKLVAEACLMHFRNLIAFFYPQNLHYDKSGVGLDVIAGDYAPAWDIHRPNISAKLENTWNRAKKELAHLTTSRKDGSASDKDWDFADMSMELKPVVDEFLKRAERTLLHTDAIDELSRISNYVKVLVGGGPVFNSSSPPPATLI